ncbi:IpaD/SipD/SspD family type III secretion system needle tip protein [Glaciimonas sp. PCH181]|uniref:IpaD/SipD/SspD family type III secretion system needle tip protein n=1 Tax=Glaciimonas sp. PCH181 TaxID=2133943 RepID=UPI000D35813E|nr:IpaD/SipD/SspD family type III secretion system needle tip protein [Glaciimonas sp. PCH181]PUA19941.1 hypothetical protein C7W93_09075 [Glaciimonas sp. PCH181]
MSDIANVGRPAPGALLYKVDAKVTTERQERTVLNEMAASISAADTGMPYRSTVLKARAALDEILQVRTEMHEAHGKQDNRDVTGTRIAGSGYPYDAANPTLLAKEALAERKLEMAFNSLSLMLCPVPLAQVKTIEDDYKYLYREFKGTEFAPFAGFLPDGLGGDSSWEICLNMINTIRQIKAGFISVYENAMSKNKDFYTEFSDILAEMGNLINESDKENHIRFDSGALKSKLVALQKKYGDVKLFQHKNKAEALAWAERLGLPAADPEKFPDQATCVEKIGGVWVVKLDLGPVKIMISKLADGVQVLSSAKFQAWQAGFKAQEENLKNTMQTLSMKYTHGNDSYNNLLQVLSKLIDVLLSTDTPFFQI